MADDITSKITEICQKGKSIEANDDICNTLEVLNSLLEESSGDALVSTYSEVIKHLERLATITSLNKRSVSPLIFVLLKLHSMSPVFDDPNNCRYRCLRQIRRLITCQGNLHPFFEGLPINQCASQMYTSISIHFENISTESLSKEEVRMLVKIAESFLKLSSFDPQSMNCLEKILKILLSVQHLEHEVLKCFEELLESDQIKVSTDLYLSICHKYPGILETFVMDIITDFLNPDFDGMINETKLVSAVIATSTDLGRIVLWKIFDMLITIYHQSSSVAILEVLKEILASVGIDSTFLPAHLATFLSPLFCDPDEMPASSRFENVRFLLDAMAKEENRSRNEFKICWMLFPSWLYCLLAYILSADVCGMKLALAYFSDEKFFRITLTSKVQKLKEMLNTLRLEELRNICDCTRDHLLGSLVVVHCLECGDQENLFKLLSSRICCQYLIERIETLIKADMGGISALSISKKAKILFR